MTGPRRVTPQHPSRNPRACKIDGPSVGPVPCRRTTSVVGSNPRHRPIAVESCTSRSRCLRERARPCGERVQLVSRAGAGRGVSGLLRRENCCGRPTKVMATADRPARDCSQETAAFDHATSLRLGGGSSTGFGSQLHLARRHSPRLSSGIVEHPDIELAIAGPRVGTQILPTEMLDDEALQFEFRTGDRFFLPRRSHGFQQHVTQLNTRRASGVVLDHTVKRAVQPH